jgi:hypothetical protein
MNEKDVSGPAKLAIKYLYENTKNINTKNKLIELLENNSKEEIE